VRSSILGNSERFDIIQDILTPQDVIYLPVVFSSPKYASEDALTRLCAGPVPVFSPESLKKTENQ
jgi:hypothetical protein